MNYKLNDWTRAEQLWIWRKEKGLTCATAAKRLGTSRVTYWLMERGKHVIPAKGWAVILKPSLTTLLRLARRRSRVPTERLAARLKTSRMTLLGWEREANQGLVTYWEKRGFSFP